MFKRKVFIIIAVLFAVLFGRAPLVHAQHLALNAGPAVTPTPIAPDPLITITPYNSPTPTNTGSSNSNSSQGSNGPIPTISNPLKVSTIPELVSKVIRILFGLIALVAVVVIIIAGFRMVALGSNPAERTKAKNAIVWAVIGLLVALMSFSIVGILQKLIQT